MSDCQRERALRSTRTDLALALAQFPKQETYSRNQIYIIISSIWAIAMQARDHGSRKECNDLFVKTLDIVRTHKAKYDDEDPELEETISKLIQTS